MKIIFAGTPEFSVPPLQTLIASDHEICAVYTQPDRPAGRGRKLRPGPVKECALEHNLRVCQPLSLKTEEALEELQAFKPDLMIVVAYGLILPKAVLDTPTHGCINIHASLLPRWRGAAPIQRAILAGDALTGITLMQMDVGLDTGAMLAKSQCAIDTAETASELHDRLAAMGAQLLGEILPATESQQLNPVAQDDSGATYAHKLSKQEAELDWTKPAPTLQRQVMAFNAWPVAQTSWGDQRLRVWRAAAVEQSTNLAAGTVITADKNGIQVATGDGALVLQEVQLPGGRPMQAADFVNAHDLQGVRLG